MNEQISLGTCPTCGGPAQFIEGGQVRHVDLRTAGTGPSELNALADSWRSRYDNASSSDELPTGHDCADELDALAERVGDGELARLERAFAKRVADELEYQCLHLDGGWLDTTRYRGTFEPVAELQFLESFGLLERHPEHPELVRVKEPTKGTGG